MDNPIDPSKVIDLISPIRDNILKHGASGAGTGGDGGDSSRGGDVVVDLTLSDLISEVSGGKVSSYLLVAVQIFLYISTIYARDAPWWQEQLPPPPSRSTTAPVPAVAASPVAAATVAPSVRVFPSVMMVNPC